jgi:hypothetical protein
MSDKVRPKRLVGFNCPPGVGGWGKDVIGNLLGEFDEGWMIVATHISSGPEWSKADIRHHASTDFAGIAYEWVGQLTGSEAVASYPPAPEPTVSP